jgi:phosphoglucosamine mutase
MKLFGTSGIRRIADAGLVEIALKAGMAAGQLYGTIAVGCDSRTSSDAVKHAFLGGALLAGADCTDIGLAPTPTVAMAAEKCEAGLMVTASHNPPEYNGLKFINPDGSAFDISQEEQIEKLILEEREIPVAWQNIKNSRAAGDAVENHISRIMSLIPGRFPLKVALDCGGGAGSVITPLLLKRMGCEVVEQYCIPNGNFPRPSEPTEKNLQDLVRLTAESGADLGIAHDGDADRMMAVDDRGRFIPGDKLLVMFSRYSGGNDIVTTFDASMIIDEADFTVRRTKIGDTYVSVELRKGGNFGGEPSGSWIFPENSLCPDGIYAAAKLVSIASQRKLSGFADEIPQYPILRTKMPLGKFEPEKIMDKLEALNPAWTATTDGIKLGFGDGWVMIRPSGTEPILRLAVEARDEATLNRLYEESRKIVEESL